MEKWKPLNMELRSWVIGQVLRLEQTSSSAIRSILRMFKENSKTLGNQSSALSFKSKVDLLYDLEELEKTEYTHLLKLMEIRNQFAHNPQATSFEELDDINPDINKYLIKFQPKEIEEKADRETILKTIFSELFKITAGKLLVIDMEYSAGMEKEIRKHINDAIVENIEQIWDKALAKNKENNIPSTSLFLMSVDDTEIDRFYYDFRVSMSEFAQGELKNTEGDNLKTVFKQKKTTEESMAEIRVKKKSEKK